MHPMHQIQTHTDHHHQQQQHHHHSAHIQQQDLASVQQQQQQNMTVLESLEPPVHETSSSGVAQSQPILSSLDPVVGGQQVMLDKSEDQPPMPIIHHLVQVAPAQPPHLHLLRAPCRQQQQQESQEQQQVSEHHELLSQQEQEQQQQLDSSGSRRNSAIAVRQQQQQQHRPQQLDGIVADGGGPIVQWLLENYEIADGESLPRSTVYNHYLAHCRQLNMNSVNAASFGKLIRSVFLGLKTRRLGTRGHSKYHYFGVRAKQHVRLDWIQETTSASCSGNHHHHHQLMNTRDDTSNQTNTDEAGSESGDSMTGDGRLSSLGAGSHSSTKRIRRQNDNNPDIEINHGGGGSDVGGTAYSHVDDTNHHQLRHQHQQNYDVELEQQQQQHYSNGYYTNGHYNGTTTATSAAAAESQDKHTGVWSTLDHYDLANLKNHLGLNRDTLVDENWPSCDLSSLERQLADRLGHPQVDLGGLDLSSCIQLFETNYKSYYKRMVELLGSLQFKEIEHLWLEFWHPTPAPVAHETVGGGGQWVSASATSQGHNGSVDQSLCDMSQYGHPNQNPHQQQPHQNQNQQQNRMITSQFLNYNQLYQLTGHPAMIERINQIDYKLYSAIESYLMPDLLNPLPSLLVDQIRGLARDFGSWLEMAIKDYVGLFVGEKMKSARAFEYALRRYTSINRLATASRAIWTRRSTLAQMSADLNRVDLRDIEHQVSLMGTQVKSFTDQLLVMSDTHSNLRLCTSSDGLQQQQNSSQNVTDSRTTTNANDNIENVSYQQCVGADEVMLQQQQQQQQQQQHEQEHGNGDYTTATTTTTTTTSLVAPLQPAQLIQSFLHLLDDPYPANMWPDWCRSLVESRVCGQSMEEAQNFILKWNFYISLILRELTLKSAPSLSSFQLIRLLFDEYLYYLVVARLAQAQNKTSTQLLRPSLKFQQTNNNNTNNNNSLV